MADAKIVGKVDPETLKIKMDAPQDNQDNQTDTRDTTRKNESDSVPLSRLNAEIEKGKALKTVLSDLAEEFIQEIPEEYRDLIPDELSARGKIAFIRKATKAGLFRSTPQDGQGSTRPGKKIVENFENMTSAELLAAGTRGK